MVSPVHVLMMSIQAVRGLPHLRAPGIVPCIPFFQATPLFPHGVTTVLASLLWKSSSSFLSAALLKTHSFVFFAIHETCSIFLSPFISKAPRRLSTCFLSVQLPQPYIYMYVATGHTSAFISRIFIEIGML